MGDAGTDAFGAWLDSPDGEPALTAAEIGFMRRAWDAATERCLGVADRAYSDAKTDAERYTAGAIASVIRGGAV